MTRVGFVGLGNIGRPMVQRLAATVDLWVYDVVPEAAEGIPGATVATSVADLAPRVDVLCVMVRDDDQVRAVAAEVLTAADPPVLVIHSTVAPSTPAEIAASGLRVLDAPVSGGPMGAADGSLAIMVGGEEAAYAVAEPVLVLMGSKVVHAGPLGAGTRMKLARNLIHFVAFTAVTEAQRLAEASGLDLKELGEVVRHTDAITGGPGAIMYRDSTATLDPDDFWWGVFDHVRALGEKDLSFGIELAGTLGVDVPLAQLARENLAKGLGL
jgi:3-hydroxyisobutyrate dehydrogenase-like beta-hydroxyacid dehydrogenase